MTEPRTLQQKLLEKLFKTLHVSHPDAKEVPYNKCRECNRLVHEVIEEATEPPKAIKPPVSFPKNETRNSYEDMGMWSAYDAFEED